MIFVVTAPPHAVGTPGPDTRPTSATARARRTRRYRVANPNHIPMGPPAYLHVFVNERGESWDEGDEFVPDAEVASETLQWLIEEGLIVEQPADSARRAVQPKRESVSPL